MSPRGKLQAAVTGVVVLILVCGVIALALRNKSTPVTTASGTNGVQAIGPASPATVDSPTPAVEPSSAAPVVVPSTPPASLPAAVPSPAAPKPAKVVPVSASGVQLDDPNPTLGAIRTPSWAQEPPTSTTLHTTKSSVNIYPYTKGVAPSDKHGTLITLQNPTYQGIPLTMAGFGEQDGYILALLDVRPNQTYGWVKASDVRQTQTPYRIEISEGQHKLLLWKNDTVMGQFKVAVGAPATYTPTGFFFVNALLQQAYPQGDYGPWIVSSSGFSEVYTTFGADGGDAAIGLHGSDEPGSIGYSVSHGCIRMYNSDITLMAHTVPVGTLFEIHA